MRRTGPAFQPFASRGRQAIAAILVTFALFSAVSVDPLDPGDLALAAPGRGARGGRPAAHARRALRQRRSCSSERAAQADPADVGALLDRRAPTRCSTAGPHRRSTATTTRPCSPPPRASASGRSSSRSAGWSDLTATGAAFLAGRPVARRSADARTSGCTSATRSRGCASSSALTSNVSLNAARSIATADDRNIDDLITLQIDPRSARASCVSLLLAWALIGATRRQTAHFRSLVTLVDRPRARVRRRRLPLRERLGRRDARPAGRGAARARRSPRSCIRTTGARARPPTRTASRARSCSA